MGLMASISSWNASDHLTIFSPVAMRTNLGHNLWVRVDSDSDPPKGSAVLNKYLLRLIKCGLSRVRFKSQI